MSILEKLQSDMEDDAYFNLSLEERYELLKRDAETIAKRLDSVVAMLEPSPELIANAQMDYQANFELEVTGGFHDRAVAIAEGRTP